MWLHVFLVGVAGPGGIYGPKEQRGLLLSASPLITMRKKEQCWAELNTQELFPNASISVVTLNLSQMVEWGKDRGGKEFH